MAERQFEHRIAREKEASDANIAVAKRAGHYVLLGQLSSLLISLAAIGSGVWVAIHGQPWVATAFGGSGVVGLVNGIIQSRKAAEK